MLNQIELNIQLEGISTIDTTDVIVSSGEGFARIFKVYRPTGYEDYTCIVKVRNSNVQTFYFQTDTNDEIKLGSDVLVAGKVRFQVEFRKDDEVIVDNTILTLNILESIQSDILSDSQPDLVQDFVDHMADGEIHFTMPDKTGNAGKAVLVNLTEDGFIYAGGGAGHTHLNKPLLDSLIDSGDGSNFLADDGTYKPVSGGGSSEWGTITGDINSQTDLVSELDSKANAVHTHNETDVTDLDKYTTSEVDTLLSGKLNNADNVIQSNNLVDKSVTVEKLEDFMMEAQQPIFTGLATFDGAFVFGANDITVPNLSVYISNNNLKLSKADATKFSFTGGTFTFPVANGIHALVVDSLTRDIGWTTLPYNFDTQVLICYVIRNNSLIVDKEIFPTLINATPVMRVQRRLAKPIPSVGFTKDETLNQMSNSSYEYFMEGCNFGVDPVNPSLRYYNAQSPTEFIYIYTDGNYTATPTSTFVTNQYDNSGTLDTVPNNDATIQVMFMTLDGKFFMLYGQRVYGSVNQAKLNWESYDPDIMDLNVWTIPVGAFIIRSNNFQASNGFTPIPVPPPILNRFSSVSGGGGGSTGGGDMYKSVYDSDNDGIVDRAEMLDDGLGNTVLASEAVKYKGEWAEDTTYTLNDMVTDNGYLGIALNSTTDRPAPIRQGESVIVGELDPTITVTTETDVSSVIVGQRYDLDESLEINAIDMTKIYNYFPVEDANVRFQLFLIENPTTQPNTIPLSTFPSNEIGYQIIGAGNIVKIKGSMFDIIAIITSTAGGSNSFTYNWDYKRSNGDPSEGEIYHQSNNREVRIHKTDKNSIDTSTDLDTLEVGDNIKIAGTTYTITELVSSTGSVLTVDVTPQSRVGESNYNVDFTKYLHATIPHGLITDKYLGNSSVYGFKSLTGYSVSDIVLDDNSYGIDIEVQELIVSEDWDIVAGLDTGTPSGASIAQGNTASRPINPPVGFVYFDTTIGHAIWYNGTNWVDATGSTV